MLLEKIFKRNLSITDPKAWNQGLWNLYGSQSSAGVTVDENTALTMSAVFACIRLLANTVAQIPVHLYRRTSDNGKERATERPIYSLIHSNPNAEMSSFRFRQTLQGHLASWGNAYAYINRDKLNRVLSMWPLRPDRMTILPRGSDGRMRYEYQTEKGIIPLSPDEVLHIPGFGFDGMQGYSIISLARQGIGLAMAAEEFGARFFGEGTHPGIIVKHPGKLSTESHASLKKDLTDKWSSLGKAHKLLLLEEEMSVEKIGVPPEDSQFIQTRQFQVQDVARWYGIPPHLIQDETRSSFNNIEQQALNFVIHSATPWLVLWEQELSTYFLKPPERKSYFFEFNVEGLLRGDSAARVAYYTGMWNIGAITHNEIRAKENMNPVKGGNERYVPLNMNPVGQKLLTFEPEPEKPEEEPEDGEENTRSWFKKKFNKRDKNLKAATSRQRIADSYYDLIKDAAQNIVNMETKAIGRAVTKYLGERGKQDFNKWLDDFYENEISEQIKKRFLPTYLSFAEQIKNAAASEVNFNPDDFDTLDIFVNDYLDRFVARHTDSSIGQMRGLMKDVEPEDLGEVINTRTEEWGEKRADKVALDETTRFGNAIAMGTWIAAGSIYVMWINTGKRSCPYCRELNNKKIKIGTYFVKDGEDFQPGGTEKMKINGSKMHPPLHQGCICMLVSA